MHASYSAKKQTTDGRNYIKLITRCMVYGKDLPPSYLIIMRRGNVKFVFT
jgi:hypothetical protein